MSAAQVNLLTDFVYSPNFMCYFIVKNFKGDDGTR